MPITDIVKREQCTGCSACFCVCPTDAIRMAVNDADGFQYPEIDVEKCVDCDVCNMSCPLLQDKKNEENESVVYAGWSNDNDNRLSSTSGGAFFEIAKKTIENGGCVVAAKYDTACRVVHSIAHTLEELECLRQSKYVQSDMGDFFARVKEILQAGTKVLFCGTPCQTAGLKSFLKKEYDDLLTVNFICRGVNSPKAYAAWLSEIENKEKAKATRVWFKNKTYGWKNSPWCTKIIFNNGVEKLYYQKDNLYMRGYLIDNLYMRKSCGECQFKNPQMFADITLGDFWGASSAVDDDKGTSVIFANTEKGKKQMQEVAASMQLTTIDGADVLAGNVCLKNSAKLNSASDLFLRDLSKQSFSKVYLKYRIKKKVLRLIRK